MVVVYVDDLNPVGTPATCKHVVELLTIQFEMKLLSKTSFGLGLQILYILGERIFLHQTTYTQKLLKHFGMNKSNPLSVPMIGHSKNADDPYRPCEDEEEYYDKTCYLVAIGALLYLPTFICLKISFATSVLTRHNQKPSIRYWNEVKHLLYYLQGTEDLGLLYTQSETAKIIGNADAGFKSHKISGKSQTGYIFLKNIAPILWKSVKQTVTATSSNHLELIAFHEAIREVVWSRSLYKIIMEQCGLAQDNKPTAIFEDNGTCVAQVGEGFIKFDRVKHIPLQIFGFTQELMQSRQIEVKKVESAHNLADMLTKALLAYTHKRLVQDIGMRLHHELVSKLNKIVTFFFYTPIVFLCKGFSSIISFLMI